MITGMQNTYKASLITEITNAMTALFGAPPAVPNGIAGIAGGIANAEIPFLVNNVQVNMGQTVATTGTATAQSGTVTSPGTIS